MGVALVSPSWSVKPSFGSRACRHFGLQACGGEDEAPGACVICEKVFRARYSLSSSLCMYIYASSDQGRRREDLRIQDAYSRVGHDRGRTESIPITGFVPAQFCTVK